MGGPKWKRHSWRFMGVLFPLVLFSIAQGQTAETRLYGNWRVDDGPVEMQFEPGGKLTIAGAPVPDDFSLRWTPLEEEGLTRLRVAIVKGEATHRTLVEFIDENRIRLSNEKGLSNRLYRIAGR